MKGKKGDRREENRSVIKLNKNCTTPLCVVYCTCPHLLGHEAWSDLKSKTFAEERKYYMR